MSQVSATAIQGMKLTLIANNFHEVINVGAIDP